MDILILAMRSLWHRRLATSLTVVAISLSVALFVGVNKTKESTRDAFSGAISRVDLIVGPRTGTLSLLLYSVFHVGSATHNVSMQSVQFAKSQPSVAWVVPFSLGDGYRGFPVVGTTGDFFDHFKIRDGQAIQFLEGKTFSDDREAVVGFEVAQSQRLKLGDKVVLSHGHTEDGDGFEHHDDHPFTIVGVTAFTGTPIDRSVYVSLEGMGEIHQGHSVSGGEHADGDEEHEHDHAHESDQNQGHSHDHSSFTEQNGKLLVNYVSGFFLGAKNRMDSLQLQRELNNWEGDALLAIMPGMAMAELWKNLAIFETAMSIISVSVVISGLIGLFVSLLVLSAQRHSEMVVLRAIGAGPKTIFALLAGEAILLVLLAICLGMGVMYVGLWLLSPWLEQKFAINFVWSGINSYDLLFAGALIIIGGVVGVVASLRAYIAAMHDGLATRL